jgi:hypothetical protein
MTETVYKLKYIGQLGTVRQTASTNALLTAFNLQN